MLSTRRFNSTTMCHYLRFSLRTEDFGHQVSSFPSLSIFSCATDGLFVVIVVTVVCLFCWKLAWLVVVVVLVSSWRLVAATVVRLPYHKRLSRREFELERQLVALLVLTFRG